MKEKIILVATVILVVFCIAGCQPKEPDKPVHIEIKQPAKKHIVVYNGDTKVFDCIGSVRYKNHDNELNEVIIQIAGDED